MLREVTFSHVTAKKWLVFDLQEGAVIKGYKYRQLHDIASISKLMTFYTAYHILKEHFLAIGNFQILVTKRDSRVGGTCLPLHEDSLLSLEDALYALMLVSSNNVALAIANNLGSFLLKKKRGEYFSCFDLNKADREANLSLFLALMKKHAADMELKDTTFTTPHGLSGNISSALDVAHLASECFKIPLFSKIVSTRKYTVRPRHISEDGDEVTRICLLENTNRLLGRGCLGGKTGSNSSGGESFVGYFEGTLLVVVLGCAGKEEKFADCYRLVEWVHNKLELS